MRTTLMALVLLLAGCGDNLLPIDVADSMALSKQPVTVLLQGLNQKAPGTVGVLGQLEVAENTRISRGTAQGFELVRRNGLVEVADVSLFSGEAASRMTSFGGGLVASTTGGLQRYDPSSGIFRPYGQIRNAIGVAVTDLQTPIKAVAGAQTPTQASLDVAYIGDTSCFVWFDQDGAVQFVVRSRGLVLSRGSVVASGATNTKIVALGTSFFVFWKEANAIRSASISSTTFFAGVATTVIAAGGALAGTDYDIQAGFDATHIALLYRSAAGTYVRVLVSAAFALSASTSDAVAANQPDVALCWLSQPAFGGSLFYATLNAANGLKIQTINATTLAITATVSNASATVTNVRNMTGGSTYSPGFPRPFVLIDNQFTDATGVPHRFTDISDPPALFVGLRAAGLASRVFYLGPIAHVSVIYASTQAAGAVAAPQPSLFIADFESGPVVTIVGKALAGRAGAPTTFALTSMVPDSSGVMHGLFAQAVDVDTTTATVILNYGMADVAVAQNPATVGAPISFGGVVLVPGGELTEADNGADNDASHEQGFRTKPEIPILVEGAAASGSIAPGTRSYVIRWKWTDSSGQVYRSAMSTPVAITTVNANSSVAVKFFGANALTLRPFVQAEVFRTPLNGTGDVYFRVTPSVFTVDTSTAAVSVFTDTASEATLNAGEPFDASATAELDNIAPPALNDIIEHKGRPFGIDAERPNRIRFGKVYTPGTSVAFTDSFFMDTPDATGPAYKLMSMDGHLIAFKRDSIYVFSGDYPDADGTGATIPTAVQLPVGVGTEQPRSVVLTDLGIVFYSSKRGFWLLNRSLGVDYIGAAVEATSAGQTVSGATVHPTYPEVRFTTEGGTTFVLNTYFTRVAGQPIWTTFTGQACVHSIVHAGDWYLLTAGGKLLKEDLTRWQDGVALGGGAFTAGAPFTRRVKVSDINFAGVGGFGRVYSGTLVGEWYASEMVKITITDNHRSTDPATGLPAAETPFTYDATINPDPYMLDFYPAIGKVTAMDVQIEDTSDFQTQGSAWTALNFIVGVKGGAWRQGISHSMAGGARKF